MAKQVIIPDNATTILLGSGYDSVTGEDRDRIMSNSDVATLGGGSGTTSVTVNEVRTIKHFHRIVGLHSAASLNIGKFAGGANVSSIHNYEFNSHSYYLAVNVLVEKESQTLANFELRDEAQQLVDTPDLFYRVAGDHFVASKVLGGHFAAIIKLESETESQLNDFRTSFSGKFTKFLSGDATYSSMIQETYEKFNGSCFVIRRGGDGDIPIGNPNEIKEAAKSFPSEILDQDRGIPFKVGVKQYRDLIDFANASLYDITSARQVMESYLDHYYRLLHLHNEIIYIVGHPKQFENPDIELLVKVDERITEVLNKIRTNAQSCIDDTTEANACQFLQAEEILIPEFKLPRRTQGKYKLKRSPACGIERYEKVKVARSCRVPANGEEIVETRVVKLRKAINEMTPNSPASVTDEYERDNYRKLFDELAPSASSLGFDPVRWRIRSRQVDSKTGSSSSVPSTPLWQVNVVWNVSVTLEAFQYRYAQHQDCGFDEIDDLDKPIYNLCRHPSHGYEDS